MQRLGSDVEADARCRDWDWTGLDVWTHIECGNKGWMQRLSPGVKVDAESMLDVEAATGLDIGTEVEC